MPCSISGCERTLLCKGLCSSHYGRLRKYGDVRADIPIEYRTPRAAGPCAAEGCNLPVKAKGYCNAHYTRVMTHGDPLVDKPIKPIRYGWDDICFIEGCEKPSRKLGRCETHYSRWRATGVDERPTHCEICKDECLPRWDHCHQTGAFRGWICNRCNLVLGTVQDSVEVLTEMIAYLTRSSS